MLGTFRKVHCSIWTSTVSIIFGNSTIQLPASNKTRICKEAWGGNARPQEKFCMVSPNRVIYMRKYIINSGCLSLKVMARTDFAPPGYPLPQCVCTKLFKHS